MFKQTKTKQHNRLLQPSSPPGQSIRLARQFSGLLEVETRGSDPVQFGKYRGCNHRKLITDLPYCRWILSTEDGFAMETKKYITNYLIENDISLTNKKKKYRQKNIKL